MTTQTQSTRSEKASQAYLDALSREWPGEEVHLCDLLAEILVRISQDETREVQENSLTPAA